jgi:ribosome-associated translation inhibitor RaiA
MRIRVAHPDVTLQRDEIERIEKDLEKIDRRLEKYREVNAEVRVNGNNGKPDYRVVLEVDYGKNHLLAKAESKDVGQAVREARDDVIRQINDRSPRGHSSFAKGL